MTTQEHFATIALDCTDRADALYERALNLTREGFSDAVVDNVLGWADTELARAEYWAERARLIAAL